MTALWRVLWQPLGTTLVVVSVLVAPTYTGLSWTEAGLMALVVCAWDATLSLAAIRREMTLAGLQAELDARRHRADMLAVIVTLAHAGGFTTEQLLTATAAIADNMAPPGEDEPPVIKARWT